MPRSDAEVCSACVGSGDFAGTECQACNGQGFVGRALEFQVHAKRCGGHYTKSTEVNAFPSWCCDMGEGLFVLHSTPDGSWCISREDVQDARSFLFCTDAHGGEFPHTLAWGHRSAQGFTAAPDIRVELFRDTPAPTTADEGAMQKSQTQSRAVPRRRSGKTWATERAPEWDALSPELRQRAAELQSAREALAYNTKDVALALQAMELEFCRTEKQVAGFAGAKLRDGMATVEIWIVVSAPHDTKDAGNIVSDLKVLREANPCLVLAFDWTCSRNARDADRGSKVDVLCKEWSKKGYPSDDRTFGLLRGEYYKSFSYRLYVAVVTGHLRTIARTEAILKCLFGADENARLVLNCIAINGGAISRCEAHMLPLLLDDAVVEIAALGLTANVALIQCETVEECTKYLKNPARKRYFVDISAKAIDTLRTEVDSYEEVPTLSLTELQAELDAHRRDLERQEMELEEQKTELEYQRQVNGELRIKMRSGSTNLVTSSRNFRNKVAKRIEIGWDVPSPPISQTGSRPPTAQSQPVLPPLVPMSPSQSPTTGADSGLLRPGSTGSPADAKRRGRRQRG